MSERDSLTAKPLPRLGAVDRFARKAISTTLPFMDDKLYDKTGKLNFHDESAALDATITVKNTSFFRNIAFGGSLAGAESYIRGDWDCDDLTKLVRIFIRNSETADQLDGWWAKLMNIGNIFRHRLRPNSLHGSQRNIEQHYDLSNDFFRLWLDESMAYSSGIFLSPNDSLAQASLEKFDRICRKLELKPSDRLLEIGTGWGGLAIHAARAYRCNVTTTTISKEQYRASSSRFKQLGIAEQVTLLKQDYRELTGQYDKLVSIEMIEAVGYKFYDSFFKKCSELLRPDGSMVLQAIVMPERRYRAYLRSVEFIQRYIFPGGCLPSLSAILESAGRVTDLRLVHVEDFAPHYAETLRRWKAAFLSQISAVRSLKYSENFIRMWTYYLCYCEALFEERYVSLLQIQFDKPDCRRDPMRLSIHAAQSSLSRALPEKDSRNKPQYAH